MPSRTITKYHFHMGQSAVKSVRPTLPTATMRTRTGADAGLWLYPGTIVQDAIRGREYRVSRFLGRGGFGAAYEAVRLFHVAALPDSCVLKVTIDAVTWHREAYFGHLLRQVPALVEVHDSFAWVPQERPAPLYCLVSEYLEEGDLGGYLHRNPSPWPEARARREIVRLLRAVTRIHESGAAPRRLLGLHCGHPRFARGGCSTSRGPLVRSPGASAR